MYVSTSLSLQMNMGERTRGYVLNKLLCQCKKLRNRMNPWLELGIRKTQVERLWRQEFLHRYQSDWDCTHPRVDTKPNKLAKMCNTYSSILVLKTIIGNWFWHDYILNSVSLVGLGNTMVDPSNVRAACLQYKKIDHSYCTHTLGHMTPDFKTQAMLATLPILGILGIMNMYEFVEAPENCIEQNIANVSTPCTYLASGKV